MPKEIEKKFLVIDNSWENYVVGKILLKQAYIAITEDCIVRVRLSDKKAWLTVKGKQIGFTRTEFEYEIPLREGIELLKEFSPEKQIIKTRFFLECKGNEWIVDVFDGNNEGLVIAEIELRSEKSKFFMPEWLGEDVTTDFKYTNLHLVEHPFNKWEK